MSGTGGLAPASGARVSALWVYPLKSAAGIAVDTLVLDALGAAGDRRWMLVDAQGEAVTARTHPSLVRIQPAFASADRDGPLVLAAPGMAPLLVPMPEAGPERAVRVWDDAVPVHDAGDGAAAWCSAAVGAPVRLVRLADVAERPLRAKYAGPVAWEGRRVALSDGAPLLLLGEASVAALQARLAAAGRPAAEGQPRRFRANILVAGTAPHEEDQWRAVQVGAVRLGVGSACPRCVLTTVDPDSAAKGVEPLRTLAGYRTQAGAVMFGMNATHAAPGVIRRGDAVRVAEGA
jgi:uncharacterized protein YcbX